MRFILLAFLFVFSLSVQAQKQAKQKNEKQLQAFFDYKIFEIPNDSSYIEGYVQFQAAKLYYKPVNQQDLQGQLAIQYELKRGDSVYARNTYTFLTPVMKDSIVENFIEVFRIKAKPGVYDLKLGLLDVNSPKDFVFTTQLVEVPAIKTTPTLSDVIIAEYLKYSSEQTPFNKNGVMVYPRIQNFFDTQDEKLPFYLEAYHLDSTKTYALRWSIFDVVKKENLPNFTGAKKISHVENPVITSFVDIADLPSGEYNLILELFQSPTSILSKKEYFFAKQTDELKDILIGDEEIIMDPAFQASIADDSVYYYVRSLFPLVGRSETKRIQDLLKTKDKLILRNYMEKFWIAMAKVSSPKKSPYDAWLAYKGQVQLVERKFKAINMPGYATDRGRVYLQYGSPSSIIAKETSPSEYPYEIWSYDKIKQYSNRKFVFYSPDLLQSSYQLLHSDMFGELANYRWQHDLTKRNSPVRDIDDANDGNIDHFGGNSSIYYKQH